MSSEEHNEDPLKKLVKSISEAVSSETQKAEEQNREKNKNLHGFIGVLADSISKAESLKDDDMYKLQLKEEKVKNNFLGSIKDLVQADIQTINERKDNEEVSVPLTEEPLNNFISLLGDALEGKPLPKKEKPTNEIVPAEEPVETTPPVEENIPETDDPEEVPDESIEDTVGDIMDYVGALGQDEQSSESNELMSQVQEYIEDLFGRYKTQIASQIAVAGGGGTNAVNYAAGGVINGDLNINGQILSGGEDLDSIFVNESGDTMTGDLNILANLSAQEIEVNQAYTFPTTAPLNTQVIVNEDGTLIWGQPEKMHLQVRNNNSRDLPVGTPIFVEEEIGNSDRLRVCEASACDPSVMPAIGILETTLGPNEDGYAIINGVFNENISGFTGLDEGDVLYVGEFGGLTNIKPEGPQCLIQNIGTVVKTNGTKIQGMKVSSIDRTNDIPNLSAGHIFYGEGPYYIQTPLVSAVTEGLKTTTVSADGFYSTGPILSGGVNIDTLFGSGGGGGLTKPVADTYYVNIEGDTMTGQLNVPTISAQSLSADDLTLANESLHFQGGGSIEGDDNGNILIRNNTLSVSALSATEITTTGPILSGGVNIDTLFGSGGGSGEITFSLSGIATGDSSITADTFTLSGDNNIGLIANSTTNTITLSGPINVSQLTNDAGYMTGLVQAAEAQILDPTQHSAIGFNAGQLALATDSALFFANIEGNVNQHPHGFKQIDPTATDIGIDSKAETKHATQDTNLIGLGEDYISDKLIFNCRISDNSLTQDGSIKFDSTTNGLFIYKNGAYKQLLDGIRINSDERDQLEYLPDGKLVYIDVHTGDSDDKDINGTSLIQEYQINSGAYQNKVVISGGTF
jgi:hypothetical protein